MEVSTQDISDALLVNDETLLPINKCIPYNNDKPIKGLAILQHPYLTRHQLDIISERGLTTSCYTGQRILLIRYFLLRYNIYNPILEHKIFKLINSSMISGYGDYGGGPLKEQGRKSNNKFLREKDVSDIIPALTWLCEISSNLFNFITNKCISLKNQEFSYFKDLFERSLTVTIPIIIVINEVVIHWFILYRRKIFSTWGDETFYIKYSYTQITVLDLFYLMTSMRDNLETIESFDTFSDIMKKTMLNSVNALNAYDKNRNLFNPQIQINDTLNSYKGQNIDMYELVGYQPMTRTLNPNITYINTLYDVINSLSEKDLLDVSQQMQVTNVEESLIEAIENTNQSTSARGIIKSKKEKRKTRKQRERERRIKEKKERKKSKKGKRNKTLRK